MLKIENWNDDHKTCRRPVYKLTKTCQTFSFAPSKEQNRMLTPVKRTEKAEIVKH